MLTLNIPQIEKWDEGKQEFIYVKAQTLQLEHSLVSLSKWESKWHKAFLGKQEKTDEETLDYIKCMTLTKNVDPMVYKCLSSSAIKQIKEYIDDPMTAIVFSDNKSSSKGSREIVTAELIYYWMIALNVPFDPCQKWHLNRLLTLIQVCNIKNQPPKKMSRREILSRNASLNAARRQKYNTTG